MLAVTKYFVSTGRTESGDELVPLIWTYQPTHDQVEAVYREMYEDEYEEVGFVNFNTTQGSFEG